MALRSRTAEVPGVSLAVVGGGMMGGAIVGRLVRGGVLPGSSITVVEPKAERRREIEAEYGVATASSVTEVAPDTTAVILAVKPQVIETVMPEVATSLPHSLLVSIAAGISTAQLEGHYPAPASVVRVMPNTPALVGQGMSLVSAGSVATSADLELVRALFEPLGRVEVIEEGQQNLGTAISGSGPAYFSLLVAALEDAAVDRGLDRALARSLAVQTMLGTAQLLTETSGDPRDTIRQVSSPGGTTVAALASFSQTGFEQAVSSAVDAAVIRAQELGGS